MERTRLSDVKSEYVQHLSHCQERAQESLRDANHVIFGLRNSLQQQEKVQETLNERMLSMQAVFENNDRQLKSEIKQMQEYYLTQLRQAQCREELSAQELNLHYVTAENNMSAYKNTLPNLLTGKCWESPL